MGKHYVSGFEDYMTRDGAKLLAQRIEDYWRGRVKTTVVREMTHNGNQPVEVWFVRSNLVRGLPPKLASVR